MGIKFGINGFGRIGRVALRAAMKQEDFDCVAINDHKAPKQLAYLYKFDSVHGKYEGSVDYTDDSLIIDGREIKVFTSSDPAEIPWGSVGVEYILECTGKFTKAADASRHLLGGAKKVIISAPSKDAPMFVMGVNHDKYDKSMQVVSNASCTTNCLAPLVKIVNDAFGVESGIMTTIHAMTSSQNTVDGRAGKDEWRMGRAASTNMIPATTGAAAAVGKVIPELLGKLTGVAVRVPTVNVSLVDLVVNLKKPATYAEICAEIKRAAENEMKGFFDYTDEPVVSQDFVGSQVGGVFDADAGLSINDKFTKLFAWYDNEWGYTSMALKLIRYMHSVDNAQ